MLVSTDKQNKVKKRKDFHFQQHNKQSDQRKAKKRANNGMILLIRRFHCETLLLDLSVYTGLLLINDHTQVNGVREINEIQFIIVNWMENCSARILICLIKVPDWVIMSEPKTDSFSSGRQQQNNS